MHLKADEAKEKCERLKEEKKKIKEQVQAITNTKVKPLETMVEDAEEKTMQMEKT